jgi:cytidine deaminase
MLIDWKILSYSAWTVRENAFILGKTKVGAAVLSENNKIYVGCNVEQRYRNHDVHAEVNAISNMISNGDKRMIAILIAAERDKFTPCGSCLDWIFQFGGENTLVAYQTSKDSKLVIYTAKELMPHYPQ